MKDESKPEMLEESSLLERLVKKGERIVSSLWDTCFDHLELLIPDNALVYKIEEEESETRIFFARELSSKKDPCSWELTLLILLCSRDYQRKFQLDGRFYPSKYFTSDFYAIKSPSRVKTIFLCSNGAPDYNEYQANSRSPFYILSSPHDSSFLKQQILKNRSLPHSKKMEWLKTDHRAAWYWIGFMLFVYIFQFFSDSGMPKGFELAGVNLFNLINQEYLLLFSGPFLHAGFAHLAFNLTSIFFLWSLLSRVCSAIFLHFLFIVSLLGGMLFSLIFVNGTSIGISGAVYGLVGALIYGLWQSKFSENEVPIFQLQLRFLRRMIKSLLAFSLLLPILIPRIDFHGHLGGLLFGYFFTALFAEIKRRKGKLRIILYLVATLICVGSSVMYLQVRIGQFAELRKQHEFKKIQSLRVKEFFNTQVVPMKTRLHGLIQMISQSQDLHSKDFQIAHHALKSAIVQLSEESLVHEEELIGQYVAVLNSAMLMFDKENLGQLKENYLSFERNLKKVEDRVLREYSLIREKE